MRNARPVDRFIDKVAVVTGGASGIGRALCEELARRKALVVVADISEEDAREVASTIIRHGGRAEAARLDVARPDEVQDLIARTVSQHGHLDFMFNNAGIGVVGEVRDLQLEHWHKIIDVNLWGVIYGTSAAYAVMIKQGFGHIVNTASLSGLIGCPTLASYTTTKMAVVGLSTSLRVEAADLGVKVSVVCPGYVQTAIFRKATYLNVRREYVLARLPFKKIAAEEAARLTVRGIERNRAIIVFPLYARFLWWLNRLHVGLGSSLGRRALKDFRAARIKS